LNFSISWSLFQIFALLVNIIFSASTFGYVGEREELFAELTVIVIFAVLGISHIVLFLMFMKAPRNTAGTTKAIFTRNVASKSFTGELILSPTTRTATTNSTH
jgi:hypothetical protein